jgi:flagellar basal-body rod modification protein FlgD
MATPDVKTLGQNAFLQLLTTQLKFQDPLKPMESTEFVTQLAQFSQLEETTTMNKTLGTSLQYMASLNNYGAAGLLGKTVQVIGGSAPLVAGSPSTLTFRLAGSAKNATLQISDPAGNVVRTINVGAQPAGVQEVNWNGRDNNGNVLPSGRYSYTVAAVDQAGAAVKVDTYNSGTVTGVIYDDGIAYLTVAGQKVPASDVVKINN